MVLLTTLDTRAPSTHQKKKLEKSFGFQAPSQNHDLQRPSTWRSDVLHSWREQGAGFVFVGLDEENRQDHVTKAKFEAEQRGKE